MIGVPDVPDDLGPRMEEAVARGVPSTAIAHSLFARFTSRQDDSYAMKVIAALREQFGGHAVRRGEP